LLYVRGERKARTFKLCSSLTGSTEFSTFRFFAGCSAVELVTELGALEPLAGFSAFSSRTGVEGRESVADAFPLLVVESPATEPTRFPPRGVELLGPPDEDFFPDLLKEEKKLKISLGNCGSGLLFRSLCTFDHFKTHLPANISSKQYVLPASEMLLTNLFYQ
jgi:hypothetical protein